jgi:hypothetical protein
MMEKHKCIEGPGSPPFSVQSLSHILGELLAQPSLQEESIGLLEKGVIDAAKLYSLIVTNEILASADYTCRGISRLLRLGNFSTSFFDPLVSSSLVLTVKLSSCRGQPREKLVELLTRISLLDKKLIPLVLDNPCLVFAYFLDYYNSSIPEELKRLEEECIAAILNPYHKDLSEIEALHAVTTTAILYHISRFSQKYCPLAHSRVASSTYLPMRIMGLLLRYWRRLLLRYAHTKGLSGIKSSMELLLVALLAAEDDHDRVEISKTLADTILLYTHDAYFVFQALTVFLPFMVAALAATRDPVMRAGIAKVLRESVYMITLLGLVFREDPWVSLEEDG